MIGLFKKTIGAAIESGIDAALGKAAPNIVDSVLSALWSNKAFPMLAGGQVRLMQAGMPPAKAWKVSKRCLVEFLDSEKVEFGDPDYHWGTEAGRTLVEEMEIEHWDAP